MALRAQSPARDLPWQHVALIITFTWQCLEKLDGWLLQSVFHLLSTLPCRPIPQQRRNCIIVTLPTLPAHLVQMLEEGLPPAPAAPLISPCLWAKAGSAVEGLCVRFARPLVPLWNPPPSRSLLELVPPRPSLKPFLPTHRAMQEFKEQVGGQELAGLAGSHTSPCRRQGKTLRSRWRMVYGATSALKP